MAMDPEKRAEHRAKLRKLYHAYRERMPGELAALRALAGQLAGTEEGDRTVLTALRQQLHTIAGSGGTFGQAALSEQARVLELGIIAWLDLPALSLDREARHQLEAEIAALPARLIDVTDHDTLLGQEPH